MVGERPYAGRLTALGLALALMCCAELSGSLAYAEPAKGGKKPTPTKPKKPTRVEILSFTEGAQVYVDDRIVGSVPLPEPIELSPGKHTLKLSKRGFADYFETIEVPASSKPFVLEIDLIPISGILVLQAQPPNARVLVDGTFVGQTPFDGDVDSGSREVQLDSPCYLPWKKLLHIDAGERYAFDVVLEPDPAAAPVYERWWFWTGVGVLVLGGAATTWALLDEPEAAAGPRYPQVILP